MCREICTSRSNLTQNRTSSDSLPCFLKSTKGPARDATGANTMIDTIILSIPAESFVISNYERFRTTPEEIAQVRGFRKFPNNPTREEWGRGYYPRLTLGVRPFNTELKIEFSAPKLIYNGDNTTEIEEGDRDAVLDTLHRCLKEMGVLIHSRESLTFADVTDFHAAKNVILSGGYRAMYVLRELSKIDLHTKLDLTYFTFKNGGHALHCHADTYELVFYDKYAEAFLSKKKRIDPEASYQPDLFAGPRPEILRIEARLNDRRKMNIVLKELGFPPDPLFKDAFRKDLCQKVIRYFWHKIITDKNQFLFHPLQEPQRLYALIKQNHPEVPHKEVAQLIGLYVLSRDRGIRELRTLVEKHNSKKTWVRTKEDIKKLDKLMPDDGGIGFINEIERALEEFRPYKPKS